MRPFLKWAGNKYSSLNILTRHLPQAKRLVEPFAGSAALSLNTHFTDYLLADFNGDLIDLYSHLKHHQQRFINLCQKEFTPLTNDESHYYAKRAEFNQRKTSQKKSTLFLYLNRHGYNGLCRYNLSGILNVPFGRYVKPYFPTAEMQHFAAKSHTMTFQKACFEETFANSRKGDVIYCDPPYIPLSKSANFTSYSSKSFDLKAQETLAELARKAAKKGIPVLISNHDTPLARKLYKGAHISSYEVPRYIGCTKESRKKVKEILAFFK